MEKTDMRGDRYDTVDVLKGVGAVLIIFTHYAWTNEERLRYLFPFWVNMAVPVFMIISGYVSAKSFQRQKIECFEDAYKVHIVRKKMIRYTVPFAITFAMEEVIFRMAGIKRSGFIETFKNFLGGGVWSGKLLLSLYDTICIFLSAYLFYYQKI